MELIIRSAKEEEFCDVFSLLKQLFPTKELNKVDLDVVFKRGVTSENDELFCAELDGKIKQPGGKAIRLLL